MEKDAIKKKITQINLILCNINDKAIEDQILPLLYFNRVIRTK